MEVLSTIVIGMAVMLILIGLECATRKRRPRQLSKEEAYFFYNQGFCDTESNFDHAWKWYHELFMKGGKNGY